MSIPENELSTWLTGLTDEEVATMPLQHALRRLERIAGYIPSKDTTKRHYQQDIDGDWVLLPKDPYALQFQYARQCARYIYLTIDTVESSPQYKKLKRKIDYMRSYLASIGYPVNDYSHISDVLFNQDKYLFWDMVSSNCQQFENWVIDSGVWKP